ncbi:MAG: ClC family H(+)/Cl(-) exchange transporter [Clostridia bacterium]
MLPVLAYGGVAGFLSGVVVSLFNYIATILTRYSNQIYSYVGEHLAFIPLLFGGLIVLALLMSALHHKIPQVRGSGIPQTEGVLRGLVTFKWLRVLVGTIVGSFISFFAGLSVGSEGPSVQIGAATAQGASELLRSRLAWQRYVITGGASAGLAVAFNAPLTGIIFSLEEAHRRFTPMILMSSASSVIFATVTYHFMTRLWGGKPGLIFDMGEINYIPVNLLWLLVIVGIVCGVCAIFFNFALINSQKALDKKTKNFPYWARLIVVFVLTGVVGLLLPIVNGGGHSLIEQVANMDFSLQMLLLILVVKFIMVLFCFNSGATGGLFIPMLAFGALIGGICGQIFIACGLDPSLYKAIVCISMTTFFGASVRAPITAVVLIVELTGYSTSFLSTAIAIFTAYLVAELLGNKPIYDSMLARFCRSENKGKEFREVRLEVEVELDAFLVGKAIGDVLWPSNCLVTAIVRENEELIPDGEVRIKVGDKLLILAQTADSEKTYDFIKGLAS